VPNTTELTMYFSQKLFISATVLGTQFTVNAFKGSSIITIHLYEGKLLVKQSKENKQLHRYFLYPGDEYSYNKTNDIAKLTRNKNEVHSKRQGDLYKG
jgi:ferric-dicitrate binding protein FerR (iron transport regulator)